MLTIPLGVFNEHKCHDRAMIKLYRFSNGGGLRGGFDGAA